MFSKILSYCLQLIILAAILILLIPLFCIFENIWNICCKSSINAVKIIVIYVAYILRVLENVKADQNYSYLHITIMVFTVIHYKILQGQASKLLFKLLLYLFVNAYVCVLVSECRKCVVTLSDLIPHSCIRDSLTHAHVTHSAINTFNTCRETRPHHTHIVLWWPSSHLHAIVTSELL